MVRARLAFLTVIASTLLACGASYHTVYEGDVRFEHCYRLDADSTVPAASRLACWSDWTHNHTSGQTRDRVEYALGRERTLLGGESQPAGPKFLFAPGATSSALLASSGPAIACPLPASPYENPPATLPAPTPVASVAKDPPGMTTSQLCVRDCGNQFTTCATKCKRSTCVTKCGDLAKSCIGDCLLT